MIHAHAAVVKNTKIAAERMLKESELVVQIEEYKSRLNSLKDTIALAGDSL